AEDGIRDKLVTGVQTCALPISRFRGPKETKQVTRQLETGEVDVVIGTHRLLSRDVGFHDLGLLIVDEEHRFGVRHKERLKALKRSEERRVGKEGRAGWVEDRCQ